MFCCGLNKYNMKQYIKTYLWIFNIENKHDVIKSPIKLDTCDVFTIDKLPDICNEWENISTPVNQ